MRRDVKYIAEDGTVFQNEKERTTYEKPFVYNIRKLVDDIHIHIVCINMT